MFNNVHVWGFGWPVQVSKFRRGLLEPLCSNSERVSCRIALLKFPSPSECTIFMNGCSRSDRMLTYLSPVIVVSRRIRGPIPRQLHTPHTIIGIIGQRIRVSNALWIQPSPHSRNFRQNRKKKRAKFKS
ncbi:uncharacterized protein TNCV_2167641 [Trichonephila clavipes]|nr:uncharacterized protein TNCV_2167641 [Trichonephila clavipes]